MEIDALWFLNYLRMNGTRIVIPKEAKSVDGLGDAINEYKDELDEEQRRTLDEGIELYFEENSVLQIIGRRAFWGCKFKNKVIIPNTIKEVRMLAFNGAEGDWELQNGAALDLCDDYQVLPHDESINVPATIKKLHIYINNEIQRVIIPEEAQLEKLTITASAEMKEIVIPEGTIKIEKIEGTRLCSVCAKRNDKYLNIEYELMDEKTFEHRRYVVIFDIEKREETYRGEVGIQSSVEYEKMTLLFNNIWDCDVDRIKNIPFSVRIEIRNDYFSVEVENRINIMELDEWKSYSTEEIEQIQERLRKIVAKVNVPPEGIKDREKIIYAQIIRAIADEDVSYDKESCRLLEEEDNSEGNYRSGRTQNLYGLVNNQTVCTGFSRIVEAICHYFNLDVSVIYNSEHAWNLARLDGETFEDDFTWYVGYLRTSNIMGLIDKKSLFLQGKDDEGKRKMDENEYHQQEEVEFELSEGLSINKMFNLLTMDWSKVTDWESVDLEQNNLPESEKFKLRLRETVTRRRNMWRRSKERFTGNIKNGIERFISRIKRIAHIKKEVISDEKIEELE